MLFQGVEGFKCSDAKQTFVLITRVFLTGLWKILRPGQKLRSFRLITILLFLVFISGTRKWQLPPGHVSGKKCYGELKTSCKELLSKPVENESSKTWIPPTGTFWKIRRGIPWRELHSRPQLQTRFSFPRVSLCTQGKTSFLCLIRGHAEAGAVLNMMVCSLCIFYFFGIIWNQFVVWNKWKRKEPKLLQRRAHLFKVEL